MKQLRIGEWVVKNYFVFVLIFVPLNIFSQLPEGSTILDRVDENMYSKTRYIKVSMEIGLDRTRRTMVSLSWAETDKKAFTEYLSPAREKGIKMLRLDRQLWIYSPSTD